VRTDVVTPDVQIQRKCNYQIAPLLLDRWSPRSMTGEPLTDEESLPVFEAARWAPSSNNCSCTTPEPGGVQQVLRFSHTRKSNVSKECCRVCSRGFTLTP
jgi:nitroreductase